MGSTLKMVMLVVITLIGFTDDVECFTDFLRAVDYRGTVNKTRNGTTCQKWTSQTPHNHQQLQAHPTKGLGDHNFCRNPDGEGVECFTDYLWAADYRGTVNRTVNDRTCQKWTSQTPVTHTMLQDHPTKGLGDHNFCRNPDGGDWAWCYTTDPSTALNVSTTTWTTMDYRGFANKTVNGRTCQKWTSQTPYPHTLLQDYPNIGLGDHNFCRNPAEGDWAWCYTTDPSMRYEYCDIGRAQPTCG
ncbi:plasminogen-like [Diadema antillarum]|uniref:plasminogen-like n=1 Tax=Diadema antillarum TaxID=105358 RepID=UPI003A8C2B2D